MANSFLDAGTYPSLMEAFPRSPGTANILIKAFVSSGQFLLPLIISLLVWAGTVVRLVLLRLPQALCLLTLCFIPLYVPTPSGSSLTCHKENHQLYGTSLCSIIDLASYSLYGYISMATFYLVSQWLAQYGQFVAGMSYTMSIKLLSIYTVGSLLCVFITAPLHS